MVGGIRSALILSAALGMLDMREAMEPIRSIPDDPERARWREQERRRREQRNHEQRAWERKQRRQAQDEMRERLLRQRIAEGRDDREDKYLHASARRRRAAQGIEAEGRNAEGGSVHESPSANGGAPNLPALPATDALAAVKAGEGSHIQQEQRHG